MFHSSLTSRVARRTLIAVAAILPLCAQAELAPAQTLEPFVTTATRTAAAPQSLGSAVEVISADELARQQVSSIAMAIGAAAGAPVFTSGAPGSAASLFLRGTNSNQTLFLVDGIRFSDANTDYLVFLGGASLAAGDRLEIARGPQSTLYGAEAIGGVISLSLPRGAPTGGGTVNVEAGTFGTTIGGGSGQGATGRTAWHVSLKAGRTNNERPNNQFESGNVALRLDRIVSAAASLGATVRWFGGHLGSPGDRFTADPNNTETESNLLTTIFADLKSSGEWSTHLTLGGQDRRYVNEMPAPNPPYDSPAATTVVTNRRAVFDAQTSYTGILRNRITLGTTAELHHTRNTGFGAIDHRQRLVACFAQDEYAATDSLYLTAGLRSDDFDTYGRATTGRATIAWLALPKTVKLRTSYGTGFRSPSFLDLYGQDAFYVGNSPYRKHHPEAPLLQPERARGFDAGVDYYLPSRRGTLSASWFQTELTNLIDYNFAVFPSTVVNIGRARTEGLELSARVAPAPGFGAALSYTYLDARSLLPDGHSRLLRRPRHAFNIDLHRALAAGVTLGGGAQYVGRRADVDARTFAIVTDGGYTVGRIYVTWAPTARLTLKARIENLGNRTYEPVNGYPALGLGAFAAVEYAY